MKTQEERASVLHNQDIILRMAVSSLQPLRIAPMFAGGDGVE